MSSAEPHRPVRADGIDARQRLLGAGLKLFAEHGFEKTSVRALAQEAQVNLGAISYYFGDKEGLYRAVFTDPSICGAPEDLVAFADPGRPLAAALRIFYVEFLAPLKRGAAGARARHEARGPRPAPPRAVDRRPRGALLRLP
ncbi:MAG: TetR family transcriptional regulator [Burkholderiales bacterium]|nr:TetR family transcriptional regulator [Burkholderiales bacterium]